MVHLFLLLLCNDTVLRVGGQSDQPHLRSARHQLLDNKEEEDRRERKESIRQQGAQGRQWSCPRDEQTVIGRLFGRRVLEKADTESKSRKEKHETAPKPLEPLETESSVVHTDRSHSCDPPPINDCYLALLLWNFVLSRVSTHRSSMVRVKPDLVGFGDRCACVWAGYGSLVP